MSSKNNDKKPITIQATPEMANWMHPQDEERKKSIQKRVQDLKEQYLKKKNSNR